MKASIKKPKAKVQTIKILEHIENTEPIATKSDITWLKWVLGLGFGTLFTIVMALGGLITYLHSDTKVETKEIKAEMNRRFAEQKADMDRRFAELKTDMNKRFAELKADMKEIKRLLQKR